METRWDDLSLWISLYFRKVLCGSIANSDYLFDTKGSIHMP
jgi:hypothetical protein